MIAHHANSKRFLIVKNWQVMLSRSIAALTCASLVLLAGCSGGSGSGDDGGGTVSSTANANGPSVQGYAVKGPLKNATTSLYLVDLNAPNLKGQLLDTGTTDAEGNIVNLNLPVAPTSGPFLLEVTGGKELDDSTPVIPTLRTIIRTDQLAGASKTPIVATPLTTLVTEMARSSAARKNNAASGTVTLNNFFTASGGGEVGAQASVVKASLGLGLLNGINLFTAVPLITGSNDAAVALRYRTAVEVNAALFVQVLGAVGTGDADAVFTAFAQDLSDGAIDGEAAGAPISALSGHVNQIINLLSQSPSALMALPVPGVTGKTVAELNVVLAQQASVTEVPAALTIAQSTVAGVDTDGDGKVDVLDTFPNNPSEWADTDNDCATARGYTSPDYLTAAAGNGCGDHSDYAPQDPAVQNSCQAASGSNDPNKPVANAGSTITRLFTKANYDSVGGRTITLAGGNSCDPNGDNLTYQWTVVSVPMAGSLELLGKDSNNNAITKANMLTGSNTATPSFTANFAGTYILSLVVSDGSNISDPATVTVNIDKGYYVDVDGKFMFLSSLAALLLLAVPAKLRKKNLNN